MGFMELVSQRAKEKCPSIVFAEGEDKTVAQAALKCKELGLARPILVGPRAEIEAHGLNLDGVSVVDLEEQVEKKREYADLYEELEDFPAEAVLSMMDDPINFSAMMLRAGDAQGLVAGYTHSSSDVITACTMFIGLAEGATIANSYVIEEIPGWEGSEGELIAMGDCSMVPQTNAEELAGIAINIADSVASLLGWQPRVGMVSFSTTGSASHPDVEKVQQATEIVRTKRPDLIVGGELQVDACIKSSTSLKKVKGENLLKGEANILVFPDLDAGNAACKLVQIFAKANMYGAIMCGFAKPFTDLSRNMDVDDIVGIATVVAAQA